MIWFYLSGVVFDLISIFVYCCFLKSIIKKNDNTSKIVALHLHQLFLIDESLSIFWSAIIPGLNFLFGLFLLFVVLCRNLFYCFVEEELINFLL